MNDIYYDMRVLNTLSGESNEVTEQVAAWDKELLDVFAEHYRRCEKCAHAFAMLQDSDYCEIGMPLFQSLMKKRGV